MLKEQGKQTNKTNRNTTSVKKKENLLGPGNLTTNAGGRARKLKKPNTKVQEYRQCLNQYKRQDIPIFPIEIENLDYMSLQGNHNKILQTGWVNQQKYFCQSSGDWKSKIKIKGWIVLSLHCRKIPFCCVLTWTFSRCVHIPGICLWVKIFSFYKVTSHIALGPPEAPHFNLIMTLKAMSPSRVTFCGSRS